MTIVGEILARAVGYKDGEHAGYLAGRRDGEEIGFQSGQESMAQELLAKIEALLTGGPYLANDFFIEVDRLYEHYRARYPETKSEGAE